MFTGSRSLLSFGRPCCGVMRGISTASTQQSALGCIVYVSEGRDAAVLQQLEGVARAAGGVELASVFQDQPYHRSNFCFVGRSAGDLAAAATQLARAALELLDLRQHDASHPRLGVVDHMSCHPLVPSSTSASEARAGMQAAASLARAVGQELGSGSSAVPVYLYAAAHPQQQPLASIRRSLGYFRGVAQGQWAGPVGAAAQAAASQPAPGHLPLAPDFGPIEASPRWGVCCVGASPWIVNFNVLLSGVEFEAARGLARSVSERGGGLKGVQAMALRHAEGVEIACNLLDHHASPPAAVEARLAELAAAEGGAVQSSYRIGKTPEELLSLAQQL